MGVYRRKDSPWWHLWIENAPPGRRREKTSIRIGKTSAARIDSKRKAEELYATRLLEHGSRVHRLSVERPVIRFAEFAAWYDTHVVARHKGKEREREILGHLVKVFGDRLLHTIDKERVIEWRTKRVQSSTTIAAFGSRRTVPKWLQIHRFLRDRGPTPLRDLRAAFGLTARAAVRSFLTPKTEQYFARTERGVWTAVAEPQVADRVLPPPAPVTVNREVAVLKQVLAAAVPKYLERSPLAGFADLEVTKPLRRTMSPAEETAVLEQLGPVDRAIVLVGLDALVRLTDILDLRRADDHGAYLEVRDPKNLVPNRVPISTRLRLALDAVPVDPRQADWYFPTRRRPVTDANRRRGVARALQQACDRADVPYGRAAQGLTFHWSTRRTGATRMIRALGDGGVAITQKVGGWKTAAVLQEIYQEVTVEEMRTAVEAVGAAQDQSARGPAESVKKPA